MSVDKISFYNCLVFFLLVYVSLGCDENHIVVPPVGSAENVLIEDFETQTHANWIVTGDAFGEYPYLVPTSILQTWGDSGFEGMQMITSYVNGDRGRGMLLSPVFTIDRKYMNFLVGGGFEDVYVSLLVEGEEVFREAGKKSRVMSWITKDLSAHAGKEARIKIVDNSVAGWGFINADYFCLSDLPISISKKQVVKIEKKYLNFPVGYYVDMEKVNLFHDGEKIYEFDIRVSPNPDYWVYLNCERWLGREIEVEVVCNPLHSQATSSVLAADLIHQSDEPVENASFYTEPYRPYYHYSVARAWLTDVCGIFYYEGKWHLQYQRNPFGIDWGNMHWGHAISDDLLHWTELDNSIIPDTLGPVFAGMSIIDTDNVLGLQNGSLPTVVSFYTAAGGFSDMSKGKCHTQCMAYSVDGGVNWVKYAGNPVLGEVAAENRDPHVFYDEENVQWVMVLFLNGNTYGFLVSRDLVHWEMISTYTLAGEFECPDFYKIKVQGSDEHKWVLSGVHGYYQVGRWDGKHFVAETMVKDLDFGSMTFVPRTFVNVPDGRKIQMWNTGEQFGYVPFRNQMTFPREVQLRKKGRDYILYSLPIKEVERLHGNEYAFDSFPVSQRVASTAFHLKARFGIEGEDGFLEMHMNKMVFLYDVSTRKFSIMNNGTLVRELELIPEDNMVSVELLSDMGFMEIFLNNGETVGTFFQPLNTVAVPISAIATKGIAISEFKIYEMKSIWKK